MRALITTVALVASSAVAAQDFSAGSEARSWNLYAEIPSTFDARVVDVMCELANDCPADCGAGSRQMGLLRTADDALVLVTKNSQAAFSGAVADLVPYCGQTVTVDGLMIEDDEIGARNIYLVQRIRPEGGEWSKTNQFTKDWAAKNPDAKGKGGWFRRDPRINAQIAESGYLGLGLEVDQAFITYYFE